MTFTRFVSAITLILFIFISACSESPKEAVITLEEDKFTFANYSDVVVRHVDLDLVVMFDQKALEGSATLTLEKLNPHTSKLVLDSRDLNISAVEAFADGLWTEAVYAMGEVDALLGQSLTIDLLEGTEKVRIFYTTSPGASGLQWLGKEQTAGKTFPFMFSQSQAIHARSWVPLQDTPAVRFTYTAAIKTPKDLIAIMSAAQDPDGERDGDYTFDMPQAIPSYLMAIAVGDLEFRAINDTIGVYAESYIVDASAEEFADTPLMEISNAKLYGPYRWGRFDLLVLPPSFPFGGMENPRLTFLTPTLIAGDKSLTNVVAHELAHSWSGNLVTNSTWRDSWINEGLTSYVENRVMEDLYGERRAVMEQVLGKEDWQRDMDGIEDPAMTALGLPETLANPDDAFSNVAYVKGQFFMHFLEDRFGRNVFDPFLKSYFDHFAFQSIRTADFEAYMNENLIALNPGMVTEAEIQVWLYGPGMPISTRDPQSNAFDQVSTHRAAFLAGEIAAEDLPTGDWTTHEWLHFINGIPEDMSQDHFRALDTAYDLSVAGNVEIAFAWYFISLEGDYNGVVEPLRAFLIRVGRGKFIYRLYQRLADVGQGDWAREVYAIARPGYHPIAQARIDAILAGE